MPAVGRNQLDPGPFREWCAKRLMPESGEWSPEIGGLAGLLTTDELAAQLGIGTRRLYAWRSEAEALDRDAVEDALHRAGYALDEIYPDVPSAPEPKRGGVPAGYGSYLGDEEILALHRLHMRGISIAELARRIYRKAGYRSAEAAKYGIRTGFRRLGLEIKRRPPHRLTLLPPQCIERASNGARCKSFPVRGTDRCWSHTNPEEAHSRAAEMTAQRSAA